MNKLLNKYWIKTTESGTEFNLGFGVTAYSEEDLLNIIQEKISKTIQIVSIRKIVSIKELEQNHVVPNMEAFVSRGIWFPKGFK